MLGRPPVERVPESVPAGPVCQLGGRDRAHLPCDGACRVAGTEPGLRLDPEVPHLRCQGRRPPRLRDEPGLPARGVPIRDQPSLEMRVAGPCAVACVGVIRNEGLVAASRLARGHLSGARTWPSVSKTVQAVPLVRLVMPRTKRCDEVCA